MKNLTGSSSDSYPSADGRRFPPVGGLANPAPATIPKAQLFSQLSLFLSCRKNVIKKPCHTLFTRFTHPIMKKYTSADQEISNSDSSPTIKKGKKDGLLNFALGKLYLPNSFKPKKKPSTGKSS